MRQQVSRALRADKYLQEHPHAYDWHDGHTDHHEDDFGKAFDPHPHTSVPEFGGNPQAAGAGVSTYGPIAGHFGSIIPGKITDLNHYPGLERSEPELDRVIRNHDFNVYYAGGKYGKPKLSEKNYNTKHLMIYDPTPKSGGDFQNEALTRTWRKAHELSHALTYPRINEIYGEGRRLGRLGVRSPREAKRAVHWEWLAAHRQRKIHEQLGHRISDSVFHKELNTIMHDAVHRAIHGKFTEPSSEGFVPSATPTSLGHSLDLVDHHAGKLGLQHAGETLKTRRQRESGLGKSVDLYVSLPDLSKGVEGGAKPGWVSPEDQEYLLAEFRKRPFSRKGMQKALAKVPYWRGDHTQHLIPDHLTQQHIKELGGRVGVGEFASPADQAGGIRDHVNTLLGWHAKSSNPQHGAHAYLMDELGRFTGGRFYTQQANREASDPNNRLLTHLSNAPSDHSGTLWRGMALPTRKGPGSVHNLVPGAQFSVGNFSSWTSRHDQAETFAWDSVGDRQLEGNPNFRRVVLHINNPKKGTAIHHLSVFPSEQEHLLGGSYKVTRHDVVPHPYGDVSPQHNVHLEQLSVNENHPNLRNLMKSIHKGVEPDILGLFIEGVSKAVGAAAARDLNAPNPSPTSAGLPGGGAGGRGGKVLGYRTSGAPVYESERQARSGRGHASGLTGATAKEFEKLSASGGQAAAGGGEAPPQEDMNQEYPADVGKYQHSGVNPRSVAKNHGQRIRDHFGVDHHILYSGKDPSGRKYYVVHSSDTNQLHRIDAKELSGYVQHMDNLHKRHQKQKSKDTEERQRWEEKLGVREKPKAAAKKKKLKKAFDLYVAVDRLSKAVPVGTVHQWADGVSYKKVGENEWIPVTDPGHPEHPQDPNGEPEGGNYPIEGGAPTKDPWREQFEKYGLTKLPPADTSPGDVQVNLGGDIHSHFVLAFRNLKTGKIVNCYTAEYHRRNAATKWDRNLRLTPKVIKQLEKFLKPFLAKSKKEGSTKSETAISRDYQSAAIVRTIMLTGLRRGAAQHKTVGVSTLRAEHATVKGNTVEFRFAGKLGVVNTRVVKSKELAGIYNDLLKGKKPGDRLFPDTKGVNALRMLRRHLPKEFKLHDFRTLKATQLAADLFDKYPGPPPPLPATASAAKKALRKAIIDVSSQVGDYLDDDWKTIEGSYIHPNIIKAWVERVGGADLIKAQKDESLFDYARRRFSTVEAHTPLPDAEQESVEYYPLPEWLGGSSSMNKGLFLDSELFKAMPYEEPVPAGALRHHFRLHTPAELRHVLSNGHFSIISAGKSASDASEKHLPWDHKAFMDRHESLRKDLEHHGLRYTEADGMYDGPEKSFIVYHHPDTPTHPDVTEKAFMVHHKHPSEHSLLRHLGKKYNQESIIHSRNGVNEMHYTNGEQEGSHEKGTGHEEHIPDSKNYWTKVYHSPEGKPTYTKFSLNFNWGKYHSHEDAVHKAVSAKEDAENAKIGKKRYRGVTGPSTPDRKDRGRDWGDGDGDGDDEASFTSPQKRIEKAMDLPWGWESRSEGAIGKTTRGEPITVSSHENHGQDWSSEDHTLAAKAHKKVAQYHSAAASSGDTFASKRDMHEFSVGHHTDAAKYHAAMSKVAKQREAITSNQNAGFQKFFRSKYKFLNKSAALFLDEALF